MNWSGDLSFNKLLKNPFLALRQAQDERTWYL